MKLGMIQMALLPPGKAFRRRGAGPIGSTGKTRYPSRCGGNGNSITGPIGLTASHRRRRLAAYRVNLISRHAVLSAPGIGSIRRQPVGAAICRGTVAPSMM